MEEIISSLEASLTDLPKEETDEIKQVRNTLKSSKTSKPKILPNEAKALKELKQNQHITTLSVQYICRSPLKQKSANRQ